MAKKDYYKVLGVAENAPAEEIKKAYRRLAKKNHPDVTGGDKAKEARFKEVSEAYETLGDEKKRAQYDAERKSPFAGGFPPGGSPFPGGYGRTGRVNVDINDLFRGARGGRTTTTTAGEGGLGDLFSELFGRSGRPTTTTDALRGSDVSARIDIDLPVAALGGEQAIAVDGKRLNVRIPPGVDEGQTIRLAGKGEPGRGGPGDLLLEVHVRPHPQFRRHGHDLEVNAPITVDEAVLGAKVEVPTLEGRVQVTVPPGTSSGLKLRLRGKGVPRRDGTRGDLYAVTQIVLPKEIPPAARQLMVEFARLTRK